MEDFALSQNAAKVQAILNKIQPLVDNNTMAALGSGYGTCLTSGSIAEKTANVTDYLIMPGAVVSILFQSGFTVSNPTLSINAQGPKPIKLYGSPIAPGKVHDNTVLTMIYDGTNYNVIAIQSQSPLVAPNAVDLALPSGLLWCEHNVGASRPEDFGLYFSWGNTTGHEEGSGYDFSETNYNNSSGHGLSGNISASDTYDMAHHNMGGMWRLPQPSEFSELNTNCDHDWIQQDGVWGMRFTSRINHNSIFFPAAGYYNGTTLNGRGTGGLYWSSGFYSASNAYYLLFNSTGVTPQSDNTRRNGFTVRAVQ